MANERYRECLRCGCPRWSHYTEKESEDGPGCNTDEGDCDCKRFKPHPRDFVCRWSLDDACCFERAGRNGKCSRHQGKVPEPLTAVGEIECPWCGCRWHRSVETIAFIPERVRDKGITLGCDQCGRDFTVVVSFTTTCAKKTEAAHG